MVCCFGVDQATIAGLAFIGVAAGLVIIRDLPRPAPCEVMLRALLESPTLSGELQIDLDSTKAEGSEHDPYGYLSWSLLWRACSGAVPQPRKLCTCVLFGRLNLSLDQVGLAEFAVGLSAIEARHSVCIDVRVLPSSPAASILTRSVSQGGSSQQSEGSLKRVN